MFAMISVFSVYWDLPYGTACVLSWRMLHVHLIMCILLLLNIMLYKYQLSLSCPMCHLRIDSHKWYISYFCSMAFYIACLWIYSISIIRQRFQRAHFTFYSPFGPILHTMLWKYKVLIYLLKNKWKEKKVVLPDNKTCNISLY